MMFNRGKKGAIELSMGTVVIVVLGVTMLILGMVLVRSIMCSAIGLTGSVNEKVNDELNRVFGNADSEVACIGAGDAVKMVPGKENFIYCAIKAPQQASYSVVVNDVDSNIASLSKATLKSWLTEETWSRAIAPGDRNPKKVTSLNIPDNAPEGNIRVTLQISKNNQLISTQDLDFQVSRVGFVRSAMC